MRAGWNSELERLLHRADPAAYPIVRAVSVTAEDVRERQDEFIEADGSGLHVFADGVRLSGALLDIDSSITDDINDQSLDGAAQFIAAVIQWRNADPKAELEQIRVKVNARVDGLQPSTVAQWQLRCYRVVRMNGDSFDPWELAPLHDTLTVDEVAGSSTPYVIDFDMPRPIRPAELPPEGSTRGPLMVVVLAAKRADGTRADNCAWRADSTIVTSPSTRISGAYFSDADGSNSGRWYNTGGAPVPYIELRGGSYVQSTVSFATVDNQVDLGIDPSTKDVELVGQGESPGDTGLLYEVSADGSTWFEFADGDLAAADNTPRGGHDLTGLPKQQVYQMRATLTPGASGRLSPVLRRIGARVITLTDLDEIATVSGIGYGIDPLTLKGEISEATITVLRSGERDYRDPATELLASHFIGELEFRVYVGSRLLPEHLWLHIDTFLVDDYDTTGNGIVFTCVGVLSQARAVLPPTNVAQTDRVPIEIGNASLKAAYDELVEAGLGLPERYRGPGIEDDVTTVSKTITEETDGKDELDALARLAGGAVISSQGRIKFVDVLGTKVPVASFARGEVRITGQTPGLRSRVPEFFVPWNWSEAEDRFREELRSTHATALTRFGRARLDPPGRLDDVVAKWIDTQPLAERVGREHTRKIGTGVIQIAIESIVPFPYLEPGDAVVVPLDGFVARDPDTERVLKGRLWAIGVIQQSHDVMGRSFTVWIRSYGDFFSNEQSIVRSGMIYPSVTIRRVRWEPFTAIDPGIGNHYPSLRLILDAEFQGATKLRLRHADPLLAEPRDYEIDVSAEVNGSVQAQLQLTQFHVTAYTGFAPTVEVWPINSAGLQGDVKQYDVPAVETTSDVGARISVGGSIYAVNRVVLSTGLSAAVNDTTGDLEVTASGGGGGASNLADLGDVTITDVAIGEVLQRASGGWINRTLAEAGIAAAGHTHALDDAAITGQLPASKGGTGDSTAPINSVMVGNGTDWVRTAPVAADTVLHHNGTAVAWRSIAAVALPTPPAADRWIRATGSTSGSYAWSSWALPSGGPAEAGQFLRSTGLNATAFASLIESDIPLLAISKISGLQGALDGKSDTGHGHTNLDATSAFSLGAVPVNRGGTGLAGVTGVGALAINGTNQIAALTTTTADTVLHYNGTSVGWRSISAVALPTPPSADRWLRSTGASSGNYAWSSWALPSGGPAEAGLFLRSSGLNATGFSGIQAADVPDLTATVWLAAALNAKANLSGAVFTGPVRFSTGTATDGFWVSRTGTASQGLRVWADDRTLYLDYLEDLIEGSPGSWVFRSGMDDESGMVTWMTVNSAGVPNMRAGAQVDGVPISVTTHQHALTDAAITGTLPVTKGGTGLTGVSGNGALIVNGTNQIAAATPGASDTVLHFNGTSVAWRSISAVALPTPAAANRWLRSTGSSSGNYAWSTWTFPSAGPAQADLFLVSTGLNATGFRALANSDITLGMVTQHQSSLSIAATQLTGTIASARLSGSYTGVTGLGTLSSLTVSGTGTFGSLKKTSARWLKKNIEPISVAAARREVMSWRASAYDWIETGEHDWSVIADEVGEFFASPKRDAVHLDRMFIATIPVLQDHEQLLQDHQERIAALELENADLRRQLEAVRHGLG